MKKSLIALVGALLAITLATSVLSAPAGTSNYKHQHSHTQKPKPTIRSLHLMLEKYQNCPQGLVLYSGTSNKVSDQKLQFLPLYCVSTIGDQRPNVV